LTSGVDIVTLGVGKMDLGYKMKLSDGLRFAKQETEEVGDSSVAVKEEGRDAEKEDDRSPDKITVEVPSVTEEETQRTIGSGDTGVIDIRT